MSPHFPPAESPSAVLSGGSIRLGGCQLEKASVHSVAGMAFSSVSLVCDLLIAVPNG